MAIATYGTGNLNPTNAKALKKLLKTVGPWIASDPFVMTQPVPMNETDTMLWSRAVIPDSDLTPSVEAVNKTPRSLVLEQVSKQLDEFEETFAFSSRQVELGEFDVLKIADEVMAGLVAQTREEYGFSIWRAGDNVYYNANSITARNQVNGPITLGRFDKVIASINNNRGEYIMRAATGAMQQGTVPMPPSYVAFCHTDLLPDLRNLSGWREAPEVGGLKSECAYWVGSVRNIAVMASPHFKPIADAGAAIGAAGLRSTTGVNNDVYPIVILSKDALGRASLKGMGKGGYGGVKITTLGPNDRDKSDPSGKRAYVSARWYDAPVILRQHGVFRIEVGATANPA